MNDFEIFINDNPIEKVMSNALDYTVNKISDIKSTWVSNEKQTGTISWENIDLKEATRAIEDFNHYVNKQQKEIAIKVNKEINEYLESKINEYLAIHNLDFMDWSLHGICKRWRGRQEYFYDDAFIAGVEIIQPIFSVEDVENLKIEYKCEIKYY